MKIQLSSHDYINTHGKPPRGYGLWVFACDVYVENRGWTFVGRIGATGNFADARKQVKEHVVREAKSSIGGASIVAIETMAEQVARP